MHNTCATRKEAHHARMLCALAQVMFCLFLIALLPGGAHAGTVVEDPLKYGYDGSTISGGSNIYNKGASLDLESSAGAFSCGSDDAQLFINESCNLHTEGVVEQVLGIFAQVICRVENIFGTIMSRVYCSVQEAILQPFLALLTLYVTIYGVVVIMGIKRIAFNDALLHVVKMGLVAAVALNAEVGVQIGYKFFIQIAQTTGEVIFSAFDGTGSEARMENYDEMVRKGYLASRNISSSDAEYVGRGAPQEGSHWLQHLDGTMHRIINFFVEGGIGFLWVLLTLLIFFPPLLILLLYLIYSAIKMLTQAIIAYLLALLGITFLFALAPIFVSFALFKVTSQYFTAWLNQLATFSLQMMVVFTMLMFVVALDLVGFFQQVGGMIRQYRYHWNFHFIHMGFDLYTFCRVEREGDKERGRSGPIIYYRFTLDGDLGSDSTGTKYDGFPKCVQEYTFEEVESGARSLPDMPSGISALRERLDEIRDNWEDYGLPEEPEDSNATLRALVEQENNKLRYTIPELVGATDLIYFLIVRFIAVAILTYLLELFAKKVPELSSRLTTMSGGKLVILTPTSDLDSKAPKIQHAEDFNSGKYALRDYRHYMKTHKHHSFREGAARRLKYVEEHTQDQGFVKRHTIGGLLGMGAATKGAVFNRLHLIGGIAPAARTMAQHVTYNALAKGAQLGRDRHSEENMASMLRKAQISGNDFYDANVNAFYNDRPHSGHRHPNLGSHKPRRSK